jgi:hypothetical protein
MWKKEGSCRYTNKKRLLNHWTFHYLDMYYNTHLNIYSRVLNNVMMWPTQCIDSAVNVPPVCNYTPNLLSWWGSLSSCICNQPCQAEIVHTSKHSITVSIAAQLLFALHQQTYDRTSGSVATTLLRNYQPRPQARDIQASIGPLAISNPLFVALTQQPGATVLRRRQASLPTTSDRPSTAPSTHRTQHPPVTMSANHHETNIRCSGEGTTTRPSGPGP